MKPQVEWIKTGLKKRKVKVFLTFLLCATLAWLINRLSQTYTSNTIFQVSYINVPEEFILANSPKQQLQVRLKTVGFQFLGYGLKPKEITLDVSKVSYKEPSYFLTADQIKIQLEAQLNNNSTLIDFDRDPIYFNFTSLQTKKVPVKPQITLSFANNHLLEGGLNINPDSITIKGPKSQIDTIVTIKTEVVELTNLTSSFSQVAALKLFNDLKGTKYSDQSVLVSGNVVKFSELVVEVPVTVINLPEGVKVRTFPEIVEIRCQGTLERLKTLEAENFLVVADYINVSKEAGNTLPIKLVRYPKTLNNALLSANEIEFILRREQ